MAKQQLQVQDCCNLSQAFLQYSSARVNPCNAMCVRVSGFHLQLVQFRCSIVVSISACHVEDPGSIPGGGVCWKLVAASSQLEELADEHRGREGAHIKINRQQRLAE